jgi:DNA-binding CsgD family transcriptional regulator
MSPAAEAGLDRSRLTPREVEVALLLARGLQTKEVAHRLGISFHTARHHIESAYTKLGVSNRVALVLMVARSTMLVARQPAAGEPA